MSGWALILVLLVLGGVLSTLGDRLGSRVGKARLERQNGGNPGAPDFGSSRCQRSSRRIRSLRERAAAPPQPTPAAGTKPLTVYTDIYNKVKKEELDLATLEKMLNVLGRIETGELDQHSGAHEVGKLLKKMYIDAALVDFQLCREAEWLVGWPGSTFARAFFGSCIFSTFFRAD